MHDITSCSRFYMDVDINALQHLCLVSKQHFMSFNEHFWIKKFQYDKLQLNYPYPQTINKWIKLYKRVEDEKTIIYEIYSHLGNTDKRRLRQTSSLYDIKFKEKDLIEELIEDGYAIPVKYLKTQISYLQAKYI